MTDDSVMTWMVRHVVRPRHPITGRFLAFDCEIDCLEHCAGLCGFAMTRPAEGDDE